MHSRPAVDLTIVFIALAALSISPAQHLERRWLVGDSHIHSQWSPGYDRTTDPSAPINAQKARQYGLAWMVTTDHGGLNHSS